MKHPSATYEIVKDLCRIKTQECMHSCRSHVRKLVDILEAHSAPDSLSWRHLIIIKLAPALSGDGYVIICYVSCIACTRQSQDGSKSAPGINTVSVYTAFRSGTPDCLFMRTAEEQLRVVLHADCLWAGLMARMSVQHVAGPSHAARPCTKQLSAEKSSSAGTGSDAACGPLTD